MTPSASVFIATVDYARSLKSMIEAGKYNYVNPDITAKHFPIKGSGKVEPVFELVHVNKYISSDDATAKIKRRGRRPAKIEESLAFSKKYPEEQRKYPIVVLGSAGRCWCGRRHVACLGGSVDRRRLDLDCFERDWHEVYRFLAVREF